MSFANSDVHEWYYQKGRVAASRIEDILRLPEQGNPYFRRDVQSTLECIGSVHTVPHLPKLGIVFTESERYGGYTPETEEAERRLELSTRGATPRLTTAHEVGHFLDDALGNFVAFSSMEADSIIHQVIRTARRSRAIQEMEEFQQQNKGIVSAARLQILNRLEDVEIWARSYAQYIALCSSDERMIREVQYRREIETDVRRNEQWEWDDFAPISTAIDTALRLLRWQ